METITFGNRHRTLLPPGTGAACWLALSPWLGTLLALILACWCGPHHGMAGCVLLMVGGRSGASRRSLRREGGARSREERYGRRRERLEERRSHSQKMAATGQVAARVAHDINNLLTVIQGHAGLLLARSEGEGADADSLRQVVAATGRAAELTRALLALNRKRDHAPRPTDLNESVGAVQKMLGRVIGETIRVRAELSPGRLMICADPGQIEQVLLNLALNARDAMPNGGTLAFSTEVIDLDQTYAQAYWYGKPGKGRYALLQVTDTGHGMDQQTRQRMFEPYFTTKEGKGTGLGLATVFDTVKRHKGHLSVYSEPGHGTTFHIFLPL